MLPNTLKCARVCCGAAPPLPRKREGKKAFFFGSLWVTVSAIAIGVCVATVKGIGENSWQAVRSELLPTVLAHAGVVQPLLGVWWAAGEARLLHAQLIITSAGTALFSSVIQEHLTGSYAAVLPIPMILLGRWQLLAS